MTAGQTGESRMYVITAGFGTTVAMWAVAYVCRLAPTLVPGWALLGLLLVCLLAGGAVAGRQARAGLGGGAAVGGLSAVLNLLILGSVLADAPEGARVPSGLVWVPGSIVVSAVLAAIGAVIGRTRSTGTWSFPTWRSLYVLVAVVATLLVVIAGGLVTSMDAGLAVPDWPNSFGSNMFLYPLSRMTGGVYYEHAHRLYGSLVGLTTIVLAVVIWRTDDRPWVRRLGVAILVMVVVQGIMGGLRVTGAFTFTTDRAELAPNLPLAIVHGIFGQVVLATIGLLWAFTSPAWRRRDQAAPAAEVDHTLTTVLVVVVVVQLVLGALFRHYSSDETPLPLTGAAHLTVAALVAVLAAVAGLRAWGYGADEPVRRAIGAVVLAVLLLQLLLGLAALVPVLARRADWRTAEAVLATAHQANGAIFLVVAVQLMAWTRRRDQSVGGAALSASSSASTA